MSASPNPWLAVDSTTDNRSWALSLERAREHALRKGAGRDQLDGDRRQPELRNVVLGSWRRSIAAGVDSEGGLAPQSVSPDDAFGRWETHPLACAAPLLRGLLDDVAADTKQMVLVCDVDGTLLWRAGDPHVLEAAAEDINLHEGSIWTESAVGTNAVGTALAEKHALQIFSSEHFARGIRDWTCSAAPVHDPMSGETLGVIDLTGELSTAHPNGLAMVQATARMVEERLRVRALGMMDSPAPASSFAGHSLKITGRRRGELRKGGKSIQLSQRHSELLVTLSMLPQGASAEELAYEMYGELGKPVSVRAELHRLRQRTGIAIADQPYRLEEPLLIDALSVERLARAGMVDAALDLYDGPLLPDSQVPLIAELRDSIDDALRATVLASGDPVAIERWLATPSGRDDLVATKALIGGLSPSNPRRAASLSRLRRLSNRP
jgi:hypothetical protein